MTELIVLVSGTLLGALAIAYGLHIRAEFHERDRWRRFQEAMRAGGLDQPIPEEDQ